MTESGNTPGTNVDSGGDEAERSGPSPAREVGLDLLDATSRLDGPLGVVRGAGGVDMALIAFAARGRRLLRAAYRLLDAEEPDAATPLFRVMSEYVIVGRWLLKVGADGMRSWALDDLRERLNTLRETLQHASRIPDYVGSIEAEIAQTEAAIRVYGGADAALTKRAARKAGESVTPRLQGMAREAGLEFAYSFAYRIQSQTDVHATPLAIDAAFDLNPGDPGPRLRSVPKYGLAGYDLYAMGAHLLLDILRPLTERVPELDWETDIESLSQRLQSATAS